MVDSIFPTFCHINEYGEKGYSSLHRMIAASYPVTLWGPSGAVIDRLHSGGQCRIDSQQLGDYVEQGLVRVVARSEWIYDQTFRSRHGWEGARWLERFDGRVRDIAVTDEFELPDRRRVIVAPPEDGYDWADALITEDPQEIHTASRLLLDDRVPAGTRERVRRLGGAVSPERIAREVLRDARNHAQACELAGAKVPFLDQHDAEFLGLLEKGTGQTSTQTTQESAVESDLTNAMVAMLEGLDRLQKPSTLRSFLGSEPHRELATWLNLLAEEASKAEAARPDKLLPLHLYQDIDSGVQPSALRDIVGIPKTRVEQSEASFGFLLSVVGLALDPSGVLGLAGMGVYIIRIVRRLAQRLGFARPDYRGPQWPFLYAFGRPPNTQELEALRTFLRELQGSQ